MFTGIVERSVRVIAAVDGPKFRRLILANDWADIQIGQSVAVNGVCLTVAEMSDSELGFDVVAETLGRTNLGALQAGDPVNVERSLRYGDRLDGHVVQGHVDTTAKLKHVNISNDQWRFTLEAPKEVVKYLIPKGSVALDGVSLTIASVAGTEFQVALIPTTVALTTLTHKQPGYPFNFEPDVTVKTIVSTLEHFKLLPKR